MYDNDFPGSHCLATQIKNHTGSVAAQRKNNSTQCKECENKGANQDVKE